MDKNALTIIITILAVAEISNPNNRKGVEPLRAIDMCDMQSQANAPAKNLASSFIIFAFMCFNLILK
jgi:hypothetical protein